VADINVKIPVLDNAVELVKDFIQKVISPSLEEVGGLLADQIRSFRFKNQVKIVLEAEAYLNAKGIKTKKASLKVLAPLLEDCSLEENEILQKKWVALLVNTTREGSPIDNPIYSYILSQLSPEDAKILETIFDLTTKTFKQNESSITVHVSGSSVQIKFSQKEYSNSVISIDNLIRLRLIKETRYSEDNSPLTLTNLGISFLNYCKLDPS
jgi:hypothetical protein